MTKTDMVRKIITELGACDQGYCKAEMVTGMPRTSIRSIACRMRRDGLIAEARKFTVEYVATNSKGQTVSFSSLRDAGYQGFTESCITRCVNGLQNRHAGYKWEKITKQENTANHS